MMAATTADLLQSRELERGDDTELELAVLRALSAFGHDLPAGVLPVAEWGWTS
jgi:predicted lipid carrier protein YhbT